MIEEEIKVNFKADQLPKDRHISATSLISEYGGDLEIELGGRARRKSPPAPGS